MNKRIRRSLVGLFIVALFSGGFAWVVQDAFKADRWSDIGAAWAKAHAQQAPKTLAEFQSIPPAYRDYILKYTSSSVLSQMNQELASRELAAGGFTDQQENFIRDYIAMMTPEFVYGVRQASKALKALRDAGDVMLYQAPGDTYHYELWEMDRQARQLFTPEDYSRVFFITKTPATAPTSLALLRARLVELTRFELIAKPDYCICAGQTPCGDFNCWYFGEGGDKRCQMGTECEEGPWCNIGVLVSCTGSCRPC